MYLTKLLAINCGPIADVEIEPEFTDEGLPKPLIMVGKNGAGKTNLLSVITDSLIELTADHFKDVMPTSPSGARYFFRVQGPATIRVGAQFELAAVQFSHLGQKITFRSKAGSLSPSSFPERLESFSFPQPWSEIGYDKSCNTSGVKIDEIFRSGCYGFFPSNRSERPSWANDENIPDLEVAFVDRLVDRLGKPIIINSSIEAIKPWIVDIMLDQAIDTYYFSVGGEVLADRLKEVTSNNAAISNLNRIMQLITGNPEARVVRTGRRSGSRKIQLYAGDQALLPSLNALSAGQAALFSIFCSILMHADNGSIANPTEEMTGIVIVDEIDAHLHSDYQHDVLPLLIKLFPKIQFIVTSHAPLFPLGMEKHFGEDGFSLFEIPSSLKISAERFAEFTSSFSYFQKTKVFEAAVTEKLKKARRPLILCEGETDPIYLRAAATALGLTKLTEEAEFDWVGNSTLAGAEGGGKDKLLQALKLLKNNPSIVVSPIVLVFDNDAHISNGDFGMIHVRNIPENTSNSVCKAGIENLLPESVFSDDIYEISERRTADITYIKKLRKKELCSRLCQGPLNSENFSEFLPFLQNIANVLELS